MAPLWTRIRALLLPLLLGNAVIMTSEFLGGRLYPMPPGLDVRDHAAMEAFMKSLPAAAFRLMLAGWALGTLAAGWLGARLAPEHPYRQAILLGLLFLGAGVLNMASLTHPLWLWVAAPLLYLPCALLGARLGRRLAMDAAAPAAGATSAASPTTDGAPR